MKISDCTVCKHKGLEVGDERFICEELGDDFSLYMSDEDCGSFEVNKELKEEFKAIVRDRIDNLDEILEIFKEENND